MMRNTPPEEFVLVQEEAEFEFIDECLRRAGAGNEDAETTSRLVTNCDLRSVRSHGINRASGYCRALKEGKLNPDPQVRREIETPTSVVMDGDGGLGYLPMKQGTEAAIDKAKAGGIGLAIARNIGHYGAAGHYTRMCAEQGCIGFSVQGHRGTGRRSVPQDGDKPSVAFTGAPAMSFSMPGREGNPIILDMVSHALSEYRSEEFADLPGRVPGAFFKSVGLVATSVLLGGGLTGVTLPAADEIQDKWEQARLGGTVVAIDPESVGVPRSAIEDEVDSYTRHIKESYAPLPGFDEVMLPGEKEARSEADYRANGIRFGQGEQAAAQEMSDLLGVPLPWTV